MTRLGGPTRWWLWGIVVTLGYWALWLLLARTNPTYMSERALWPAEAGAARILEDPVSMPAMVVDQAIEQLQQVIARYPGTATAARAQLLIGDVYGARKDFKAAQRELQQVIDTYSTFTPQVIAAYRGLSLTYQQQEQWGKALDTYRALLQRYPLELRTIEIPLMMVSIAKKHLKDGGDSAFQEAIAHYRGILGKNTSANVAFLARQRLANCYIGSGQWEQAADELEMLVMRYPQRPEVRAWLLGLTKISLGRLKTPGRPLAVAKQFAERYPSRRRVVEPWLKQVKQEAPKTAK